MKREVKRMTNKQFSGIIKMIIDLINTDTPKEMLIRYLNRLIE